MTEHVLKQERRDFYVGLFFFVLSLFTTVARFKFSGICLSFGLSSLLTMFLVIFLAENRITWWWIQVAYRSVRGEV